MLLLSSLNIMQYEMLFFLKKLCVLVSIKLTLKIHLQPCQQVPRKHLCLLLLLGTDHLPFRIQPLHNNTLKHMVCRYIKVFTTALHFNICME